MKNRVNNVRDELYGLRQAIYDGDAQKAKEETEQVLKFGLSIDSIFKNALLPTMEQVGDRLKDAQVFIPEVLLSVRAMQGALYALKPVMTRTQNLFTGTVVMGTVAGDFHDIGKNMVAMILSAKGFSVIDLGVDVTAEAFIQAIKRYHPDIVGLSALLSTTLLEVQAVIEAISAAGLRSEVTIMVGGSAVTKEYARQIKADIYAGTLFEAGEAAEDLMEHRVSRFAV